MIESDDSENQIKGLFRRLSTLREVSQEDTEDLINEQCQSEYDIIESIEGISFMNIRMCFSNPSIRAYLCV